MIFNPCTSIDFQPELTVDGHDIEVVEEMRVLGVIITSDMKWAANTHHMVSRANKKLWVLRRLKNSGASEEDLVDIYCKQIRSLLEMAVPAWHGGLNNDDQLDIERVQKSACHIILDRNYTSYRSALNYLCLESLKERSDKLCLKKAEVHPKHRNWFRLNQNTVNTRQAKSKYMEVSAKHKRFKTSPLSCLTNILNNHYNE